jgi:hypothetical protein
MAEIHAGTVDAELGGGVYKQRLRRSGEGKSGGFRAIIFLRWKTIAIFVLALPRVNAPTSSQMDLGLAVDRKTTSHRTIRRARRRRRR